MGRRRGLSGRKALSMSILPKYETPFDAPSRASSAQNDFDTMATGTKYWVIGSDTMHRNGRCRDRRAWRAARTLVWGIAILIVSTNLIWAESLDFPHPEAFVCPVTGAPADEAAHAAYRDGQVSFCCEHCMSAFKKNPNRFAAGANMQLMATGQAMQVACPISGETLGSRAEFVSSVRGVPVQFASAEAQERFLATPENEQVKLVFGNSAFDRGFVMKSNPLVGLGMSAPARSTETSLSSSWWWLLLLALSGFIIFIWRRSRRGRSGTAGRRGRKLAPAG